MRKRAKKGLEFWMFVAPVLIPFLIFYFLPICMGLYYSLFDWNGISKGMNFIGLKNYIELFTNDKNYFESLAFTFKFALFNVVLTNVLAILMALWVNGKLKTSKFTRTCFFMPNIVCAIVAGFLWRFIFNQISDTLYKSTGLDFLGIKWLGSTDTAWVAILIVVLWQSIGYNMIIYLAGLNMIDKTFYESAAIDGAGKITKFFKITLPLMMPSITICLFNVTAQSFRLFDVNVSLTKGGPGRSTMGLAIDIYNEAFKQNRLGYGSAKAVILLIIVMTITMLQTNYTRKREVEM